MRLTHRVEQSGHLELGFRFGERVVEVGSVVIAQQVVKVEEVGPATNGKSVCVTVWLALKNTRSPAWDAKHCFIRMERCEKER